MIVKHETRKAVRNAFTLLEVLLALMLMLGLSAAMFSYIIGLVGRRDRIVAVTMQQNAAATTLDQIEHDLASTFTSDGEGNPGVQGSTDGLLVRCRGVADLAGGGTDKLADTQGTEFKFEAGAGSLVARRLGRTDEGFEPVAEGIERVRFRFFDGQQWSNQFDSGQSGSLPVAVEVGLWFSEAGAKGSVSTSGSGGVADEPLRAPDRLRLMVVPDGPVAAWKSKS